MNRYGNLWLTVLIYVLGIVALLTILSGWFQ